MSEVTTPRRVTSRLGVFVGPLPSRYAAVNDMRPNERTVRSVTRGVTSSASAPRCKAGLGGKSPNQFSLDRAYLTLRMPPGDNG
jgi:hypothetical protein